MAAWGFFDYGFTFVALRGNVTLASTAPGVASLAEVDTYLERHLSYRLRAHTTGVTVISAHDPLTGLGSSDHGCDLYVTVRNPAVRIRLAPEVRRAGLDEVVRLTALGEATDGTTRNLTQRVTYVSSDPAVVRPIPDVYYRDRSRLLTVGPGVATISAVSDAVYPRPPLTTDPSTVATIVVRDERVARIVVEPSVRHAVAGTRPRFVARGFYPSGASNLVTDSVVWTSSAPEVATQSPYVPSRLEAEAVGTATITATMPEGGVSSHATGDDATLVVEAPRALTVVPRTTTLAVGETVTFGALAELPSGVTIDLLDRDLTPNPRWAPVFFRTSAPAVLRSAGVCRAGEYVYPTEPAVALAPGLATIRATSWATDPPTESSTSGGNATVTVEP